MVSLVVAQAGCTLLGYDADAQGVPADGGRVVDLEPGADDDAGARDVGDGGMKRTSAADGSVTLPTQASDAGDSTAGDKKFDKCGLSSWLPGLIPDLSSIPDIPGITVPCMSDAGTTTSRDAGTIADAGQPDSAVQSARDAGSDASADASAADAAHDAASDAASDAAVDAAQDAATDAESPIVIQ